MKAILEIELPKSCVGCEICSMTTKERSDKNGRYKYYFCILVHADVGMFNEERGRCPECPLKIIEECKK